MRLWAASRAGRARRTRPSRSVCQLRSARGGSERSRRDAEPAAVRVGPLPVLRARGGHRHLARPNGRCPRDRSPAGPCTFSRELRRNASTRTRRLDYRPSTAQWHAERRACRSRGLQSCDQRATVGVRAGPAGRGHPHARRPGDTVHGPRTGVVERGRRFGGGHGDSELTPKLCTHSTASGRRARPTCGSLAAAPATTAEWARAHRRAVTRRAARHHMTAWPTPRAEHHSGPPCLTGSV